MNNVIKGLGGVRGLGRSQEVGEGIGGVSGGVEEASGRGFKFWRNFDKK